MTTDVVMDHAAVSAESREAWRAILALKDPSEMFVLYCFFVICSSALSGVEVQAPAGDNPWNGSSLLSVVGC
ncbi:unnamed protein product [Caretta caretta]